MAKDLPVSPLAPKAWPRLLPVAGVEIGSIAAGLRYKGRPDITLALLAEGSVCAGVTTRSATRSAAVDWCRANLAAGGAARALVVNAGNANAFTGRKGVAAVEATARIAAEVAGCAGSEIYLASTGVIGEPLDVTPLPAALADLKGRLSGCDWEAAAAGIRTTDTFPKAACETLTIDGEAVVITGVAKGSGMIAPDMATMLSFVFTDANIDQAVLQTCLDEAVNLSFNNITVDSDTSTSDTLLVFATRQAKHAPVTSPEDPRIANFRAGLIAVTKDLALQVVRDGEGAQKLIEVTVTGAVSDQSARKIAFSIANSPLIKTAIAGEDANWGRIVMAVGKSGEPADRDLLSVRIGGVLVAEKGERHPAYVEAEVTDHMRGQEIALEADIGLGSGRATVWTCDLTHGYISINADYRS